MHDPQQPCASKQASSLSSLHVYCVDDLWCIVHLSCLSRGARQRIQFVGLSYSAIDVAWV